MIIQRFFGIIETNLFPQSFVMSEYESTNNTLKLISEEENTV